MIRKRFLAVLLALIMVLSCVPRAAYAEGEEYTFTLMPSAQNVDEGDSFTVSLVVTGKSFNAYSAEISYNASVLELLDSTVPVTKQGNYIRIQNTGDTLYPSGTTLAVFTFGVKDIESTQRVNIQLSGARADISENAVSQDAKEAARVNTGNIKCSPVSGTVKVNVSVSAQPAAGGSAYVNVNGTHYTETSVNRGSTYSVYAVPNEGYAFAGWKTYESDTIISKDTSCDHIFEYDTKLTAVFEPVTYDNLDKVGLGFTWSNDMEPVKGYDTKLTGLPVSVSAAEYHLYKGESTDAADEIMLAGDRFYLPEDTDKLTLTCSYLSGSETVVLSRVLSVDAKEAQTGAVNRMTMPYASTYATGYVTSTSIDILNTAASVDPKSGELTLYAAGGNTVGAAKTDSLNAYNWIDEPVIDSWPGSNSYAVTAGIGSGSDGLVWYRGGNTTSALAVYGNTGDGWTELTALESLIKNAVSSETWTGDIEIYPFGSLEDMFVKVNGHIMHYDGSALTEAASLSRGLNCYKLDDSRVLITDMNSETLRLYNNSTGSVTTLGITGKYYGADFVNGSSDVLFLGSSGEYFMYDIGSGTSTSLDLSGLLRDSVRTPKAINRAVDGYVYALIPGPGSPANWIQNSGIAISGSIYYIWRTGDNGENWTLIDSGNMYDTSVAELEGNDDTPNTPDPTVYSDAFTDISNPVKGVTLFTGSDGALCAIFGSSTITFDSQGGSSVASVTKTIRSAVSAPASPTNGDKIFVGWYTDSECSDDALYSFGLMPGKDITLYAKWSEDSSALDDARASALAALEEAYASYNENDYAEEGWKELTKKYTDGKKAIEEAESYDAIQEALESAKTAMAAIEKLGSITVAVTVETLTVNGEYIIEPTLVEAESYEKASVVITDLLKAYYASYSGEPYRNSGTIQSGFYLQSIYDPGFKPDAEKGQVQNYAGMLSEFDCGEQSGWMYCVNGSFPNVSAASWGLSNKDVMRWQYSCTGLGADIGSDNSAWGSGDSVKVADKDALIWEIAKINQDKEAFFEEAEGNKTAYDNAMDVLKNITSSQDEVDEALEALGGTAQTADERLEKAKQAAIKNLEAYDPDDYREAEKALLGEYVAEGIAAINAAEDVDAVNEALAAAIAKIEALVTDEEYTAAEQAAELDVDKIYQDTGSYMAALGTPGVGSVGGEWDVIGLARAGYDVPDDWAEDYYDAARSFVVANADEYNRLSPSKSTENARLILALTSIGKDPRYVGGIDLTAGLNNLNYLKKQGINGPIWALIAFDSHDYEIPALTGSGTQVTRENLIETILNAQLKDGGWNLSASASASDVDMTAMAIQALAPYYDSNADVKAAVDKALVMLSEKQNSVGGYSSYNTVNSESVSQVITALTALGIDPATDSRFIKNGNSLITNLCSFAVEGGGFRHTLDGDLDGMATEQGYYALASWYRLKASKTSLYDMSDVTLEEVDTQAEEDAAAAAAVDNMIDAIGDVTLDSEEAIEAVRAAYEALNDDQKALVKNLAALEAAEKKLAELKKEKAEADKKAAAAVDAKIDAIGDVTLESGADIKAAREAYDALTDDQKALVTKLADLEAAEKKFEELKAAATQEEIDEAAASAVDKKIDAIGDVTLDSEEAITAARKAYDDLTDDQKKLVKNLATLEAAEKKLAELKKAAEDIITKAVDKTGKDIAYTLEDVDEKHILTKEKAAEVNDKIDSPDQVEILWQKDIVVPDGTEFPATLTFAVPKAYRDNDVFVYHYNGTDWEVVAEGKGSKITAKFDSLSPGALVAKTGDAAKTGDNNNVFLWAGICVVAVAAAAVTVIAGKKRRED